HLLAGEYDGKTGRSLGAHEIVEPRQLGPEDVPVEEEQRAQRLILRGRSHTTFHRQIREKRGDLRRGHLGRVTLAMEGDEPADPKDIRVLGPWTQMPRADRDPDAIEEPGRRAIRHAYFRDAWDGFLSSKAKLEHAPARDHSAQAKPSRDSRGLTSPDVLP